MILTCNACSKKFVVPDSAITATGRMVQCGSCGNKWRQFPENVGKKTQSVSKSPKTVSSPKPIQQKIQKPKKAKKRAVKKSREINLYSPEYLAKKHGITLNEVDINRKISTDKKISFGFYNSLILFLVLAIALLKGLYFFKGFIIQELPFMEFYLDYLFESIRNIIEISKNLIIRDHTHSTFNFIERDIFFRDKKVNSLFIDSINYFYELYSLKLNYTRANPILTIRHPLDSYLSARKKNWLEPYCGDCLNLDNYCKSLILLQNYMMKNEKAVTIRYEDLCLDREKELLKIFSNLNFNFKIPTLADINKIIVTGKSGRKTNHIALRDRMISEIDQDLIAETNKSSNYNDFCKMNKYNVRYDEHYIL